MLNIRQNLKFNFFLIFAFLLISIQKVNAAALACNANEIAQTLPLVVVMLGLAAVQQIIIL